jgi:hypothetical protein
MLKSRINTLLASKNHYLPVVVFVVVLMLVTWVLLLPPYLTPPQPEVDVPVPESLVGTTTVLAASAPMHLDIPAIQLSASFTLPLALAESGEVAVPESYTEVGWYKFSPTPGELGPSVILGHVDSYQGPAVFWPLGKLVVGDEINITREDGTVVTFVVEGLERYPQSDFPTEKVYGNINYAGLRLITCSGTYNKGAKRYTHNLVVYAKLKE